MPFTHCGLLCTQGTVLSPEVMSWNTFVVDLANRYSVGFTLPSPGCVMACCRIRYCVRTARTPAKDGEDAEVPPMIANPLAGAAFVATMYRVALSETSGMSRTMSSSV